MAFNKDKALKEAEKLVAKGKDRDAIRLLEEVVKNDPRDLNSVNKIGDLYLKVGDKAAALDAYAKVADKYATDGFNLRAIAMYKKCQRVDPARIDYVEKLAELNAQQGLTNEAKANFTQVAEHYLREGKGDKARAIFVRIAEIEPDNLKNRLKLADLYLKENKLQQALGEYRVIGAELAKKGMLDESLQVLEKALGLDPGNIDILRAVARTRIDMGRADDGVRFIHAKLQDKGGDDPDLLVVLGETLQAAGHFDHARQALERAQHVAPDRSDVPVALYRLCLDQGDADGALGHYQAAIPGILAKGTPGQTQQVVDDLKAILRVTEGHVGTLERLLQVQVDAGADTKVQSDWMSRLSEAYIARGSYAEAEQALTRLVGMEPEVSQHAEKLEFVRVKLRSGDQAASPAAVPAESSFAGFGEGGEAGGFSMSFDDAELESTPTTSDDKAEFVTERTAEADVFIKYGLVDKALEQLQAILSRYPDDLPTRQKLLQICRDEGRRNDELEQLVAIAGIARQQGDAAAEREALIAAQQIAPTHPAVARVLGTGPAAAPAAGGFEISLDDGAEPAAAAAPAAGAGGFELSLGGDADEPALSLSMDEPAKAPPAGGFEFSLDDDSAAGAGEFEISLDPASPGDAAASGSGAFEISLDDGAPAGAGEFEISLDPPGGAEAPAADEFEISMDAGDSGGFDFGGGAPDTPDTPDTPTSPTETIRVPPAATAPAAAAAPPQQASPAPAPAPAVAETEEGLFGEEDDFFNFAEEINRELESDESLTEVSRGDDRGMSLEEIVSGIQKGVAEQVDKEDYETHYNLGIAYKEMELPDEAIGEFQYASKDPSRFLSCCILLGACFTEKGMPELAIQWYEKGKTAETCTEDDRLALDYEIALCREAVGDEPGALKSLMAIYGTNARYRDVSQRVARLKQATGR